MKTARLPNLLRSTRLVAVLLISAAATLALGEVAVAKDIVPLKRGFYVEKDTPCNEASNATFDLFLGHAIRFNCAVIHLQRQGNSYRITESFLERGQRDTIASTYRIISNTEYTVTNAPYTNGSGGETSHFRYCEQSTLPEPWRSNEITK